jgi:hypothetical protein
MHASDSPCVSNSWWHVNKLWKKTLIHTSYFNVYQHTHQGFLVDLHLENDDTLSENQSLILTKLKTA